MHYIRGVKSMKAKLMIIAAGLLGLAVLSLTEEALASMSYNNMTDANGNTSYCTSWCSDDGVMCNTNCT